MTQRAVACLVLVEYLIDGAETNILWSIGAPRSRMPRRSRP
jgi:hypothetical protein